MNQKFEKLGFYPADILLPKKADMTKWAVVACDQFTSEPEYWERVEKTVGDAPSTLRLILPEANLRLPTLTNSSLTSMPPWIPTSRVTCLRP